MRDFADLSGTTARAGCFPNRSKKHVSNKFGQPGSFFACCTRRRTATGKAPLSKRSGCRHTGRNMVAAEIAVVALLIVINGFLAMAELAIVSSRPARLKLLAEQGVGGARR